MILMDEIHKYEGTINQFTGDGVMALFGAPVAHEDHAQRACDAALSIQKLMLEYEATIKNEYDALFKMRIGLNSGPVVVGSIGDDLRMDYTAIGDTTNLAARIQQAAIPGEICMSKTTKDLVKDFFEYETKGEVCLKGKAEPQSMYCVISEHPKVRTRFEAGLLRGITELVGRRPEMDVLIAEFEKAKKGDARILDVMGEAGVGKSRLVYEFKKRIEDEANFFTGLCIQFGGNINFLPVIDMVKAAFEIKEEMTEGEIQRCVENGTTDELAAMVPFYLNLLSIETDNPEFNTLDPQGRKYGTFEAVKDLLLVLSTKKPLVVFIEDVHWIDKISEEFFTFFSRCILDHRILMLSAYRPEGNPPWSHGAHYQRLGLQTLSSEHSIRLVQNILGGLALEKDLTQIIVLKTEGNPFFVEEIVRELWERGDIIEDGDRYSCVRPIDQLNIPNTVQGVLAARMDRLSENIKQTMQVASVIGRDFAFRILKSIRKLDEDLSIHMNNLVGLEILYEKALFPELEYIFKHALTQEVAYNSLLKQRRREIHDRIGQAIEQLYANRLEEHYEILAHHYERSGNAEKAINYLILAGEKSNQNSAIQAAHEFFKKAIEIVEGKDFGLSAETEVRLYQGWGQANLGIGAVGRAMEGHRKTIGISRSHGIVDYEKKSLISLATIMWLWPNRIESEKILNEGIRRAKETKDKVLESHILTWAGAEEFCNGSPYKGHQIGVEAERLAYETGDPGVIMGARMVLGWTERWLGRPTRAIEATEGAEELLKNTFNFGLLSKVVQNRSVALAEVGRIEDAMAILRDLIEISDKFGPFLPHASFLNSLGYCYSEMHQYEKAWVYNLSSEKIASEFLEKFPMGTLQYAEIAAQARVNLMENLFDQGKVDEAWNRFKSFEEQSKGEEYNCVRYVWESRMYHLATQILIHRNDLDQAENLIEEYLEKTRSMGTKKREGCFMRLLGEVQIRRNEFDKAIENFNDAILILQEVGNPRQLWQAYTSLGTAFDKLERRSEAQEQWGAAAELIHNQANGLSDHQLKQGFLNAEPIRRILSKQ
jgi:tetratricopeptide (TPR) repeat protein